MKIGEAQFRALVAELVDENPFACRALLSALAGWASSASTGKAARNWECFEAIVSTLRRTLRPIGSQV